MKKIFILLASVSLLGACREKIDLKFDDEGTTALIVEGYVTQGDPISTVKLTTTNQYNNASANPTAQNVEYVIIKRTDASMLETLDTLKQDNKDASVWKSAGKYTPALGDIYNLEIKYKGEIFKSESKINRPVIVDSISSFYQEEGFGTVKGYQLNYAARDLPGKGEYFFFEKWKNGVKFWETTSDKFNIWDDQVSDGLTFPPPVLFGINPSPNTDKSNYNKDLDFPYAENDSVVIKAFSIDKATYGFYGDILQQASTAEGGPLGPLFAAPMDNVRTNISNTKKEGIPAQGIFSARGVNAVGIKIKKQ